ncbi:MAG: imidazole glycerol phosphate synthase subunit HisH [Clostridiales bacterium]|nr:imidazole glycerol phosphate synthase subunit HisH [Clostridiales bacterium]
MIAIINYGSGNLFSLKSSLQMVGLEAVITSDKSVIQSAEKLILPGVGAFGDAVEKLKTSGLFEVVKSEAQNGKPILGICLGMQLLFEKSFEYGEHQGLALLQGEIKPLSAVCKNLRIPHMGWNSLNFTKQSPLFKYLTCGDFVYFVHSFYATNCDESLIAYANYSVKVPAAVQKNNIYGTQFHPEKSGEVGLKILRAFGEL